MEFGEVKKLGKYFEEGTKYEGISLWKLSEAAVYNNFLKEPKKSNIYDKIKSILLRKVISSKNRKKEEEENEQTGNHKKIIAIVSGTTQVNTLSLIINKIGDIKVIRYESPSENSTKETLEKKKIPYSNIDNYMDDEIREKIKKANIWLKEVWNKIKKDEGLKEKIGENYDYVVDALEYFFNTRKVYLEYIRLIELYKKMIEIEKPRKILVFDDVNAYGRAAVLVARQKGIATLDIQHGQLQGNPCGEIISDTMIVNGNADRDYLISQGGKKEQIIVTGQIRFDDIMKKMKLNREEVCKELGLNSKKKIVVFTAQKNIGQNVTESAKQVFFENIKKLDKNKFQFIITIRDDMNEEKDLPAIDKYLDIKIIKGGDIHKIISCCDVYITAFSTVAVEAVLMRKPVIALNINSKPDEYIDYTKLGVGFKITKQEDFLPALRICFENKKFKDRFGKAREKFIEDYNYKMDGKALERVVSVIEEGL